MIKYIFALGIFLSAVACSKENYIRQEAPIINSINIHLKDDLFAKAEAFDIELPAVVGQEVIVGNGTPESITRLAIQEALDKGGKITFNSGGKAIKVYIDKTLVVKKHGTMIDGGGQVTLDAQGERRIIYSIGAHNSRNPRYIQDGVKELNWVLKGITFINGKTTGKAYVEEPNPDFNDGSGNGLDQSGGGGAVCSGLWNQLWVVGCKFYNNETLMLDNEEEIGGGAIYSRGGNSSKLTISDSYFEGNKGTVGGAINNLLTSLTVARSIFTKNISSNSGGAIYTDGSSGDNAENSRATSAPMKIHASIFKENVSYTQGGGVFLFTYGTSGEITECLFEKNEARTEKGLGGGLRLGNGDFSISRSSFVHNIAESQGGGLWIGDFNNGRKINLENSTFFENQAFNKDKSNGLGGAITVHGQGHLNIVNCTLLKNRAFHGGGVFGEESTELLVQNTILAHNQAQNPWNINYTFYNTLNFVNAGGNLQWPGTEGSIIPGIEILDPGLDSEPKLNGGFTPSVALINKNGAYGKGKADNAPKVDQRRKPRDGRNDSGAFQW